MGSCCSNRFNLIQPQVLPIVVDGELNESLWLNLDSVRLAPAEPGVPRQMGGDIRTAVLGRYLYLSAWLPEPDSRVTARSIGRNPHWEEWDVA